MSAPYGPHQHSMEVLRFCSFDEADTFYKKTNLICISRLFSIISNIRWVLKKSRLLWLSCNSRRVKYQIKVGSFRITVLEQVKKQSQVFKVGIQSKWVCWSSWKIRCLIGLLVVIHKRLRLVSRDNICDCWWGCCPNCLLHFRCTD